MSGHRVAAWQDDVRRGYHVQGHQALHDCTLHHRLDHVRAPDLMANTMALHGASCRHTAARSYFSVHDVLITGADFLFHGAQVAITGTRFPGRSSTRSLRTSRSRHAFAHPLTRRFYERPWPCPAAFNRGIASATDAKAFHSTHSRGGPAGLKAAVRSDKV